MKKNLHLLIFCILCLSLTLAMPGLTLADIIALPDDMRVLDLSDRGEISLPELFEQMDNQPQLEEVWLYGATISAQEADQLRERYPAVFFGLTFQFKDHIVRTDQTAFSTLHNSREERHSSADFAFLRHCVRLEALDLGHNAIDDISFIEDLSELKVLILALNQIEDISPLKNLKKLEYLEIFRNRIRDISALSELENLLDLNLSYNNISDYSPLYPLKNLQRLWLYQSNGYSKGAMERPLLRQIREQLPNCTVDGVSAGTNGGWREHPRYDVIFDVFKTSVYKPFSERIDQ